ncbi:hypothetical protein DEU56DRAFT_910218 [Suillus clintonianus]|uniref:uncharacterized protein n=1 Tax=Suillus clintonianus TaxID=1904413 RepID=UPI001B8793FE|nr:uncharacterized protein DEU56DRAFT_910218 [Suillus clintonianus]KAG2145931.1 hypothetical protein DEU56DRAFT_910218 [Suillus clintonianus]
MCSSITVFLLEGTLIREVYGYLHFLPDILAWRDTSSHTRTVGTPFISARFSCIVQPFFRRHVRELTHVMHITNAVITGSCTMKMLTGGEGYMNNINFVIAHGTLDVFQAFIQDKLIYRWATTKPHYAFQSAVTSYTVYRRGELFITVSEAKIDGMFSVIASSPTTANMTMMTPGSFATFYPHWTLKRVAVLNQTLLCGDHAVHAVGCYTHPEFECHENTYWLGPACRTLCPALWLNIADGSGKLSQAEVGRLSALEARERARYAEGAGNARKAREGRARRAQDNSASQSPPDIPLSRICPVSHIHRTSIHRTSYSSDVLFVGSHSCRPLVHSSAHPLIHSSTRPLVPRPTRPLVPLIHSSTRPLVARPLFRRPLVRSSHVFRSVHKNRPSCLPIVLATTHPPVFVGHPIRRTRSGPLNP